MSRRGRDPIVGAEAETFRAWRRDYRAGARKRALMERYGLDEARYRRFQQHHHYLKRGTCGRAAAAAPRTARGDPSFPAGCSRRCGCGALFEALHAAELACPGCRWVPPAARRESRRVN